MKKSMKMQIKKIKSDKLMFPVDMYNNVYGSVVISAVMMSPHLKKKDRDAIIKKWNYAVDNPDDINWTLSDKKFVDKTLEYFGVKRPEIFPLAFIQSELNCLFAIYDKNTKEVYPLREDGIMGYTLRAGKVYPINFDSEENKND